MRMSFHFQFANCSDDLPKRAEEAVAAAEVLNGESFGVRTDDWSLPHDGFFPGTYLAMNEKDMEMAINSPFAAFKLARQLKSHAWEGCTVG